MSDGEIYPKQFDFPKNLSELTPEEREDLYRRYQDHVRTSSDRDFSESDLISPDSVEFKAKQWLKSQKKSMTETPQQKPMQESPYEFDPEKGYIVEGEDESLIDSLDLPDDVKSALIGKSYKQISEKEFARRKLEEAIALDKAKMGILNPVERDVEERFSDI